MGIMSASRYTGRTAEPMNEELGHYLMEVTKSDWENLGDW